MDYTWTKQSSVGQIEGSATYRRGMEASGELLGHGERGAAALVKRTRPTTRSRGHIEKLSSGSLRVRVYAGVDLLRNTPLYLKETLALGPGVEERAEAVRRRLLAQVAAGEHLRTDATRAELMDNYLAHATLGGGQQGVRIGLATHRGLPSGCGQASAVRVEGSVVR